MTNKRISEVTALQVWLFERDYSLQVPLKTHQVTHQVRSHLSRSMKLIRIRQLGIAEEPPSLFHELSTVVAFYRTDGR